MLLRKILQATVVGAFLAVIIGYSAYQARDYWTGPVVTIESPEDGFETDEPMMRLTGTAERVSFLTLNGRQIFTDMNGYFEEELLLSNGYNIITVLGRDAFDREVERHTRVIFNASSSLLFSSYNNKNE
jgi:hypothetical protein